ncbi:MAG: peptidase M64 [Bacteroidales bacterium]|nr:peptidase M64 [Bacteroidales bacterium]
MTKKTFVLLMLLLTLASCEWMHRKPAEPGPVSPSFKGTVDYDTYFSSRRLRLDFVLAGGKDRQMAFLESLHSECEWAGSPNALIDRFGYGQFFMEVFAGEKLIYSHGFSALFEEWRSTDQAGKQEMAMNQTLWMPFPKQPVKVVLYERVRSTGKFRKFYECAVDPSDRHIIPGPERYYSLKHLQIRGDYAHKVDLVLAGEGYTSAQLPKLREDAVQLMEYLFSMEPYKSRRDDFNVVLVESTSSSSGVDVPQEGRWRNTAMDSGFDTFYVDRYLTVTDHRKIASVLSGVPFDAVFIIANDSKYGGGGIYNSYALGTAGNRLSPEVFIHEFGHSFAGLGDEYYDEGSSAYDEDLYPAGVEPWEPNLTTLTDFKAKWADLVEKGTPVPTPNDPDAYGDKVGVFEGGGYMTKGCYRPYYECRMLNNTAPEFCPVCRRSIEEMIDFYVK